MERERGEGRGGERVIWGKVEKEGRDARGRTGCGEAVARGQRSGAERVGRVEQWEARN